jgi:PAS domain S-box-containing protein
LRGPAPAINLGSLVRTSSLRVRLAIGVAAALFATPAAALDPAKSITQYRVDSWGRKDGLIDQSLTRLVQTTDGYLALCTQGGLVRFDGMTFTTLDPTKLGGIEQGQVLSCSPSRSGGLWMTAYGTGLVQFKDGALRLVTKGPKVPFGQLTVAESRDGTVWVGGNDWGGLLRLSADGKVLFSTPIEQIRSILEAPDGTLWVGTWGGGIVRIRKGGEVSRLGSDLPATRFVWSLAQARDGTLWVAGREGLSAFRDERFTVYTTQDGLPNNEVKAVLEDRDRNLWVGTTGGLARLEASGRFSSRGRMQGLGDDDILSLHEDDEGGVWLGLRGVLNRLRDTSFTMYTVQEGLAVDSIVQLEAAQDGGVWMSTYGAGVGHLRNGRYTEYGVKQGVSVPHIGALFLARDGAVWMGSDGLRRLQDGKVTLFDTGGRFVKSLGEDERGLLVGLSRAGLHRLEGDRIVPFRTALGEEITDRYVQSIYRGRDALWLSTNEGLACVRGGRLARFTEKDGLPPGEVFATHEDKEGALWISTSRGLARLRHGKITRFEGIPILDGTPMTTILEDGHGFFWIYTARGVARVEKRALDQFADGKAVKPVPRLFDVDDGLNPMEFRGIVIHTAARTLDGRLWFVTRDGVGVVDPSKLVINEKVPPVLTEKIVMDGREVPVAEEVTVPAGIDKLDIHYTALTYTIPEQTSFRYVLEGFDRGWVDVGNQRVAHYTKLPPGTYRFKVRAANSDGVWNEAGAALQIRQRPFLHQTWWVRSLLALAGIGAIALVYRVRLRQLTRQQRTLEQRVDERTRALKDEISVRERAETDLLNENAERRNAEAKLRQHTSDLERSNQALEDGKRALLQENAERKRAEEAARIERDLLRSLMDNIPDLIYFKDANGRFMRANRAMAAFLEVADPGALVGRSLTDFITTEDGVRWQRDEASLLRSGDSVVGSIESVSTRPGKPVWLLTTRVPIHSADGKVAGLVGISKDITERKKAEQDLDRSLHAFLAVVSSAAHGNLADRGSEGADTIGLIGRSVNQMLESFSGLLGSVRDNAFSVSIAAGQILSAAQAIAKGAQKQTDKLHGTSAAVDELSVSMTQVVKSARESFSAAHEALDHVQAGNASVSDTAVAMGRIDGAMQETAAKMRLLGERNARIAAIVGRIEDVADQSKLLALNAAIEAAHAASAGAGFGVVAEEMGRLAEHSRKATSDIVEIITEIREDTSAALVAMGHATREVLQGGILAEKARRALVDISEAVEHSSALSESIRLASEEQTRTAKQVAEAVRATFDIAMESATGADETARTVKSLVELSQSLNEAIGQFKMKNDGSEG